MYGECENKHTPNNKYIGTYIISRNYYTKFEMHCYSSHD